MKTLGRILIIVAVFVLVMSVTYFVVNGNSSSSAAPTFERGEGAFPRPDGFRPDFQGGERPDFDRGDPRDGGWLFGMIKNVGLLAVIVALIVLPKSLLRRKNAPIQT